MKKPVFYTEIAYIIALLLVAVGTALTAYGGLGISMVVAPAYLLYLKLSQSFSFVTFGMMGYTMQTVVLIVLMLVMRKVKPVYFLTFVVAVCHGFILDGAVWLTSFLPNEPVVQIVIYIIGALLCCAGLSLLFSTYLPTEAYELFVKELSKKLHKPVTTVKTVYDCCSLGIAVLLSLLFFGGFQGIGIGTVACALLYGFVIRIFQDINNKLFRFADRFPLRKYFEESE